MLFLPAIPPMPREVLVAVGAVVALLVLSVWVHFGRRRYVVIHKSDVTETIACELGRIADALDRLATPPAPRPSLDEEAPRRTDGMSMFRR